MNPRAYYEHLLKTMPHGTERAVLSILRFHIGLDHAIDKEPLLLALEKTGFHLSNERQARLAITELRNQGVPVCSSSADSGYFLAATKEEFDEFITREYFSKIASMTKTARAMENHILAMFPNYQPAQIERAKQASLF